jgi:hypothetical protein
MDSAAPREMVMTRSEVASWQARPAVALSLSSRMKTTSGRMLATTQPRNRALVLVHFHLMMGTPTDGSFDAHDPLRFHLVHQ